MDWQEADILLKPELYDYLKDELNDSVETAHRAGLTYWDIFKVLRFTEDTVMMQSEAEYFLRITNG